MKPVRRMVFLIAVLIMAISLFSCGSTSSDAGNNEDKENAKKAVVEEQTKEKPVLSSIEAVWRGSTEAGTVISLSDVEVTATYDDGQTEEVSNGVTLSDQPTLTAGQTATVTVSYEDKTCELSVTCTTVDPKAYKDSCETISYSELARNPQSYVDKNIKIYGQIIQVQEDGDDLTLRVATKDSGYGDYYDDVVMVAYTYSPGESRLLEDDMVYVYGPYYGTYTYETVMGNDVTVPAIIAKYIDIE